MWSAIEVWTWYSYRCNKRRRQINYAAASRINSQSNQFRFRFIHSFSHLQRFHTYGQAFEITFYVMFLLNSFSFLRVKQLMFYIWMEKMTTESGIISFKSILVSNEYRRQSISISICKMHEERMLGSTSTTHRLQVVTYARLHSIGMGVNSQLWSVVVTHFAFIFQWSKRALTRICAFRNSRQMQNDFTVNGEWHCCCSINRTYHSLLFSAPSNVTNSVALQ